MGRYLIVLYHNPTKLAAIKDLAKAETELRDMKAKS
jgi:hypothetical protein